ncbi:hypothetical protein C8J57DRAFT_1521685 [Mycena rebaudengoi]|nr:hypothetical protein C8J57DRAFT_1521685 [Mycena rebaudengoi]
MADWSVTFFNSSNITFDRWGMIVSKEFFSGNLICEPSLKLNKSAGVETLSANQFGIWLEQSADLGVTWRDPASGQTFGVMAHVPVQIFGIGTEPYYIVKWNDGSKSKDWHKPCNPTEVYNFPDSLDKFRVEIRAQCSHQTIRVNVTVRSPLPKK